MSILSIEQFAALVNSKVYYYGDDYITLPYIVDFTIGVQKYEYLLVSFYFGSTDVVVSLSDRVDLEDQLVSLEEHSVICLPSHPNVFWIKVYGGFTYLDSIEVIDIVVDDNVHFEFEDLS